MKKNALIIFLGFLILLFFSLNNYPQIKSNTFNSYSNSKKIKSKYAIDTVSLKRKEQLIDIGISPLKDKIAIVRNKFINPQNYDREVEAPWKIIYELWVIDLFSENTKFLAKFETTDTKHNTDPRIDYPSWSPDGEWIAFQTSSMGGHSPGTTTKTWVVDSSGNNLKKIELPRPYNNFSNCMISWQKKHDLIISGFSMKYHGNKWKDTTANFIYDCKSQVVKTISKFE